MKLPEPLRAHRARLLPWLVAGVAMTVLTVGWDAKDARDDRAWARTTLVADGEVGEGYTGGAQIPVAYTNPVTDQRIEVTVYTWGAPPDVDTGDAIALEVDPDDPERVAVAGDRAPYFDPLDTFQWAGFALAWYGWRWWTVRRTARLASADGPAFAMLGAIAPASRFRRRPVLHLYPLDAPAGARSLCSLRLLSTGGCPLAGPAFTVEVKGVPRPLGRVVARAPGAGSILWPVGHTAGHRRWPRPDPLADTVPPPPVPSEDVPPALPRPGWWPPVLTPLTGALAALVAGVVLGVVVTAVALVHSAGYDAKPQGWVPAVGEVIERHDYDVLVRSAIDGEERTLKAGALYPEDYTVGRRYPLTYDPDAPSHVRLSRETYDLASPLFFAWLPAVLAAVALAIGLRRSRRAWALAREGPWSLLEVWGAPGGAAPLGERRGGGYVRAVIPRPWRGRLSHLSGPVPAAGPVMVAGVPEPGEVVAVVDAEGTVVPVTRRLRVPSLDAARGLADGPAPWVRT